MAILTRAVAMLALALFLPVSAFAEKRVALVIGNSAYKNVAALTNPANDAKAVAATLKRLGFDVTLAANQTKVQLDASLKDFGDAARGADWALVYYAGHGIAVDGETYILPVDATLAYADHVDDEAVSLTRLRSKLAYAKALRLVVLDSCRNNPFLAAMKNEGQKRAVSRGLARPSEPTGDELIAYATRENTTADDGDGAHSPFTAAFLANIDEPSVEVGYLFRKIRSDVLDATGQRQSPAIYGELSKRQLYFKPAAAAPQITPGKPAAVDEAAVEWNGLDKNSEAMLETFIARHGSSSFADYANARLKELRQTKSAAIQPKPEASPKPVDAEKPKDQTRIRPGNGQQAGQSLEERIDEAIRKADELRQTKSAAIQPKLEDKPAVSSSDASAPGYYVSLKSAPDEKTI